MRGWIHLCAVVAVLGGGPFLVAAARSGTERVALSIYVASLVALFGVSAAYHRGRWSPRGRRLLRRADHATIFLAIAGTYTAVAQLCLHGWPRLGVLLVVWCGAAVGVAVREIWLDAPKWAVALPYVVVGWCALAVVPQLWRGIGGSGFVLVIAGGIFYSVGAVVYGRRRPDPWPAVFGFHEVFHACTVVGASLQLAAIAAFALGRA